MENKYRRFLVSYSYSAYNQGYHCIANDEIVLTKEEIMDELDIPLLLKYKIQNINNLDKKIPEMGIFILVQCTQAYLIFVNDNQFT